MSKQMFGIKVNGGIVDAAPSLDEATDKAIIFYSRHHQHPWQIVPVRIVEDAEPCDWELTQNDVGVYEFSYFKFCPMCGRSLKEE